MSDNNPSKGFQYLLVALALVVGLGLMIFRYSLVHQSGPRGNLRVSSFKEAKRLARDLDVWQGSTFYCGCPYGQGRVYLNRCEMSPEKHLTCQNKKCQESRHRRKRAHRMEWEHLVPASRFGRTMPEWKSGHRNCVDSKGRTFRGRRCARRISQTFRRMEGDLYNIVPSVGSINALRGAKTPNKISKKAFTSRKIVSACRLIVSGRFVQPEKDIRGMVARAYLYMEKTYPESIVLTNGEKKRFTEWHQMYPPSWKERQWVQKIYKVQGNPHPFVRANH